MSLSNFRVLIISSYEICYNPRLIKAANFYSSRGCEVTIFNPKIGISDENLYSEVKNDERFKLIEFDISKKSIISKVLWFFSGLISRTSFFFWESNIL